MDCEEDLKTAVRDAIEDVFFSESENAPFNTLQDKINKLLEVQKAELRYDLSVKMADKFDDYMKNVDKLNQMINEFKGLVAIVRGEANSIRAENNSLRKQMRKIVSILAE